MAHSLVWFAGATLDRSRSTLLRSDEEDDIDLSSGDAASDEEVVVDAEIEVMDFEGPLNSLVTVLVKASVLFTYFSAELTIGAKIITRTTLIVGALFLQLHTHISYITLIVEELFCVMCAYFWSLVSACLASMRSQQGNYTTVMLRELISNCTRTSYTSLLGSELCNRSRSHGSGPVLRDTARLSQRYPPIARYGVLVSQHGHLGARPPPPFLSISPLESMRNGGAIPPSNLGYLSDTCAIPYENKAKRVRYPPLRYYLERVLRDRGGGGGCILHWAAKIAIPLACYRIYRFRASGPKQKKKIGKIESSRPPKAHPGKNS